jgi:hypothetical protein
MHHPLRRLSGNFPQAESSPECLRLEDPNHRVLQSNWSPLALLHAPRLRTAASTASSAVELMLIET